MARLNRDSTFVGEMIMIIFSLIIVAAVLFSIKFSLMIFGLGMAPQTNACESIGYDGVRINLFSEEKCFKDIINLDGSISRVYSEGKPPTN